MHIFTSLLLIFSIFIEIAQSHSRFGNILYKRNSRRSQHARLLSSGRNLEERTNEYRFLSNRTMPYLVDSMPDVPFELSEMYSGLIPIDASDKSRALFFVFHPRIGNCVEEVTIWLNGGPGCSSLSGFFQENGPYVWLPGTFAPVANQYSWVNLTNMIWVDFPVGAGFSIGTPTATSQEETSKDFVKFFRNFQDLFDIKNFKIYLTGESFAGRYIPYISAAMLDQNDPTYYNLSGALLYDPTIGEYVSIQEEYVAVPYAKENINILNLNESYMADLESLHQTCGYADYLDRYYKFPPAGPQPSLFFNSTKDEHCAAFEAVIIAAYEVNSCFDIYNIILMCPLPSNVLGLPTQLLENQYDQIYFNRSDVKKALHAPDYIDWVECALDPVFVGKGGPEDDGDLSPDPIQSVLPRVIEATNRVLISNGDYDMILITKGALLAIQNMTWGGKLGFQEAPGTPINITLVDLQYADVFADNGYSGVDGPQGIMGIQHFERGLMWAETYQAGHLQPQSQPRVSYRHLEWLLGRRDMI